MTEKKKKMGFGRMFAWQFRGASTGIATMIMGYLTIYATNTMKMSAMLVGTLLLVSKLIDGITDLFAGYIVDRTHTKWGKGRPYEWCVIGMWLTTWLLFSLPESFSTLLKVVWILCMYGLANSVFYTFLNANNTVYMVRAFNNQEDYIAISTYGGLIPMVFVLAFNVMFPTLMGRFATSPAGWSHLVLIFALPLGLLGMMRFFVIKETYDVDAEVEKGKEKADLKDVFSMMRIDPYIFIIALSSLVLNLITNMGVGAYYFTEIVGNISLMSITTAAQVVALPMMFILPALIRRSSTIAVIRGGIIVQIIGYVINYFAGSNIALLAIGSILVGAGSVPMSMLAGLLIIDCADYNEYRGIRRMEGSLGAVNGFATKVGSGLGSGLMGILIGLAGFDGSLAVQPASAVTMIRLLYSLIPAAMYVGLFFLFGFYKLEKQMPMIREAIEKRRNELSDT